MICDNCKTESSHIKYYPKIGERCPNCSDIKENTNTEGILTRTRVRMDSLKFEGDLLPPRKYDKVTKKIIPNEDFIKRYGTNAKNFLTKDEVKKAGFSKLEYNINKREKEEKQHAEQVKREVIHQGDSKVKIRELLK